MSKDQQFCVDVLAIAFGGHHHLPETKEHGSGVHINVYPDSLATFDFDRLTTLVLLAHKYAVRIEIGSSGPKMVKIIAHRRIPGGKDLKQHQRHPTLSDLIAKAGEMLREVES